MLHMWILSANEKYGWLDAMTIDRPRPIYRQFFAYAFALLGMTLALTTTIQCARQGDLCLHSCLIGASFISSVLVLVEIVRI